MSWRFEQGGPAPHTNPAPSPYDPEREGGNASAAFVAVGGTVVLLWFGIPVLCRVIQWGGQIVARWCL